ncbi:MAG TPA: hypothetical protein VF268_11850 [Gammaproteobacteria bacterium]
MIAILSDQQLSTAILKISTHHELARVLRQCMSEQKSRFTYKGLADEIGVSYSLLHMFHRHNRNVCIVIMNRLANHFGVAYEIKNFNGLLHEADAVGIYALRNLLRQKIAEAGPKKIRAIARAATDIAIKEGLSESKISHEWLRLFYKEKEEPCFVKMHGIAEHFGVKYVITNYHEPDKKLITLQPQPDRHAARAVYMQPPPGRLIKSDQ